MSGLVVALRCGRCGASLGGFDTDVAWVCSACGAAWEADASGPSAVLVPIDASVLVPPGRRAPRTVLLPFWRVTLDALAVPATSGDLVEPHPGTVAAVNTVAGRRVWVRAFWMRNAFVIGDPGLELTTANWEETRGPVERGIVAQGVAIASGEAVRLAELFALKIVDAAADVAGIELRTRSAHCELVFVPFADAGNLIICPVSGTSYARAVFDDFPEGRPRSD